MPLPEPAHVEDVRARYWERGYLAHADLFVSGCARSMRNAAENAPRSTGEALIRKADELDHEAALLRNVLAENPDGCVGDCLSLRMAAILACATEGDLAALLAVPVELILAGRQRMYALAAERIEKGDLVLPDNG